MKKTKQKVIEINHCEHCNVEIIGDPPFSVIRYPMPYYCSMECLNIKEKKGK